MPKREPVQARSAETRARILAAVVELVAERGLAGVSHRAVAKRAGVTLSTTSYYFSSKSQLELAALEAYYASRIDDYRQIAEALVSSHAPPSEMINAAADLFVGNEPNQLLAHLEVYLNSARRPDIRAALAPVLAAIRDVMIAAAEAAGIDDTGSFATAAIAVIEGVQLRRLAEGIDGRAEMVSSLEVIVAGALAQQAGWEPQRGFKQESEGSEK